MKAIVCAEPGHLAAVDRPVPRRIPGEVLLRLRRVGICGTDYHIFSGLHPYLEYPRLLGHELAAEVVEAPADSSLRAGEPVAVNPYLACGRCIACRRGKPNCCVRLEVLGVHRDGGLCEWLSIPVENAYPVPQLTLDQAACVEFLAIGAHAVSRAAIASGDRILVIGAGPIGLGVAIFAEMAGARLAITDIEADRLARSGAILPGDHDLIDAATGAVDLGAASHGEGFDCVFDATGSRASMEAALAYVAHGGTLVLVGLTRETIGFGHPELHKREASLLASRNATRADFEQVIAAMAAGRIPVEALITHRTTLSRVVDDLPRWAKRKHGLIKAVVEIN